MWQLPTKKASQTRGWRRPTGPDLLRNRKPRISLKNRGIKSAEWNSWLAITVALIYGGPFPLMFFQSCIPVKDTTTTPPPKKKEERINRFFYRFLKLLMGLRFVSLNDLWPARFFYLFPSRSSFSGRKKGSRFCFIGSYQWKPLKWPNNILIP